LETLLMKWRSAWDL